MSTISLSRIAAVLHKEFTQLLRDRLTYAMMLGIPIVQLLLFGYAINSDPKQLPTAVLVQDQGRFSRSVLGALERSEYFSIDHVARSPAEMDELIESGRIQFAVTIPGDFTRRVVRRDKPQILVEADASDPSATGPATSALASLPTEALKHDLKGVIASDKPASQPFEVVVQRRYNPEGITSYNIVPGLLGIVLSMTLVMMTALGVTRESERGTMETLLATPLRPLEVMIGKLTPYVMVGTIQATVIITVARLLFNVPMAGGWGALILGLLLFIVGSLSLGFLISTLARNQLQAMQMSFFYMLPSILLSGFLFPFRGMPEWAQWIGEVLPLTHFLRIIRGVMLKGNVPYEVWPNLWPIAAFMLAAMGLALLRYRRTVA
ncbi:MAG TPA: ABC transporter permease [Sphingomicrobium sp.]|nr:ABC transporter permease [Sphingomicrobium sp.]